MRQDMNAVMLQRIRLGWKVLNMIKDMLKAKLDKTLHANLFNCTTLPAMIYSSKTWATMKKDSFAKIHAGNIIA